MIHHPFPGSAQITDEELSYSRSDMWLGLYDEPALAVRFTVAEVVLFCVLSACASIAGTLLIMTEVV